MFRRLTAPPMLKFYLLGAFTWQSTQYVSVRQVIANFPTITDVGAHYSFMVTAFSRTELMMQILFAGIVATGAWFASDVYRYVTAQIA